MRRFQSRWGLQTGSSVRLVDLAGVGLDSECRDGVSGVALQEQPKPFLLFVAV